MISQHIINAKRLIGEIELLTACPTNMNIKEIEAALLNLDKETSQLWIEFDRMKNDTRTN